MNLINWDSNTYHVDLSNNNLTCSKMNGYYGGVKATKSYKTGRYYWEVHIDKFTKSSSSNIVIGVCTKNQSIGGFGSCSGFSEIKGMYDFGSKISEGVIEKYGESYKDNDVISVILDLDIGTIEFFKNGKSQGIAYKNLKGYEWYPCVYAWSNFQWTVNFGATKFKYNVPKKFKPYDLLNAKWYHENIYLLKQNENIYSIKQEFYKDRKFEKVKLISELSKDDFKKYGFDNLNDLFKKIKINDEEEIIPINILNLFNKGKYQILIYSEGD